MTREELLKKWYKTYDYSVYSDDGYMEELLECWKVYSRQYVNDISKILGEEIENIKLIVDMGCGIGLTMTRLKQIFKNADVFGTNIKGTSQYNIATQFGKMLGFKIVENIPKNIDLLFASEYFEHIENPIEHLIELIDKCKPKYLIIANSFNTKAIGHFKVYKNNGEDISQEVISKIFNNTLRENGYIKIKTGLWNNRPTYWKKHES